MKDMANVIGTLVVLFTWAAGVVMAKGFLMTSFAIICPPYGVYKVVEKILVLLKWI